MKKEISSAVDFLANLLRTGVTTVQHEQFRQSLLDTLTTHYQDHWFPEKPNKGSGYRCIRINQKMDPSVAQAGAFIGIAQDHLARILPSELTLWVDPDEVSYRIGEDGSIGVLFGDEEKEDEMVSSDDDSSNQGNNYSSSSSSSPSPSSSPDFLSSTYYPRHYSNVTGGSHHFHDYAQQGLYLAQPVYS